MKIDGLMLQLSNWYALCNQSIHGIAHINSLNDKNENAHPDIRFIIVHVKLMMPLHAQIKCDAKISRFNTHVAVACMLLLLFVFFFVSWKTIRFNVSFAQCIVTCVKSYNKKTANLRVNLLDNSSRLLQIACNLAAWLNSVMLFVRFFFGCYCFFLIHLKL